MLCFPVLLLSRIVGRRHGNARRIAQASPERITRGDVRVGWILLGVADIMRGE